MIAADYGARKVALAALATGYGRLPISDFATGIRAIYHQQFFPIKEVVIVVRNSEDALELRELLRHSLS